MTRVLGLALLALALVPSVASAASGACRPGDPSSPTCTVWTGKIAFVADGDTWDVDLAGDGSPRLYRVRVTGIQAMEQSRYSSYPDRRRGECHALAATARAEQLIRKARWKVRVAAQAPSSHSGARPRRAIAIRRDGRWQDVAEILLREGHGLWLPNSKEWAWNAAYHAAAKSAAQAGLRLWDPDSCGAGPAASSPLGVTVNWDADGNDAVNPNGEWIEVRNGGASSVSLAGWWVRDSDLRRYTFPSWASVLAGGRIRVHVGRGTSEGTDFFWGQSRPAFENLTYDQRAVGDGGYLFDPEGDLRGWDIYP